MRHGIYVIAEVDIVLRLISDLNLHCDSSGQHDKSQLESASHQHREILELELFGNRSSCPCIPINLCQGSLAIQPRQERNHPGAKPHVCCEGSICLEEKIGGNK